MKRYTLFGLAALGVVACVALSGTSARSAEAKDAPAHHHGSGHMTACAKACAHCQIECDSCANHCANLVAEGKKEHFKTLRTCLDCGEICKAAAASSARNGPFVKEICDACAKACDGCGKACEQFSGDEHMAACAKACKDCAKACREMIEHVGHAPATGAKTSE